MTDLAGIESLLGDAQPPVETEELTETEAAVSELNNRIEQVQRRTKQLIEALPAVIAGLEQLDALEMEVLELIVKRLEKK